MLSLACDSVRLAKLAIAINDQPLDWGLPGTAINAPRWLNSAGLQCTIDQKVWQKQLLRILLIPPLDVLV
ncbi:MAG: hypothetical protein ACJ0GY_06935 [Synechococcus sp.]